MDDFDNLEDYVIETMEEEPYIEPFTLREPIKVYVRVNANNNIIEVGSSIFIKDLNDWIEIDNGFGDRYAHAQSQYFEKPLINEDGAYNYKYENGRIIGG